jgi:FAD/FMN-containing dehydrogenase
MAGGAIGPGVVVDLSRMNAIGTVDVTNRRIRVGPGALRGDVNTAAVATGLRFPVDPSSGMFCTVGGMAATNAAGSHSLLHGSTRRLVAALDCVFADGSAATVTRGATVPDGVPSVKRFMDVAHPRIVEAAIVIRAAHENVRKDSSGYALKGYAESGELIDLLVGSEGTLAIVVGVELSLIDLPRSTSGVLGAFSSLDDAVVAAARAHECGAAACELLDRTFLEFAPALPSLPAETQAVLLSEVEADSDELAAESAERLAAAFRESGATYISTALTLAEQTEIWELRHAASPMLAGLDPSLKSMQFIEDGAVPPSRLADYIRGVRSALDAHEVRGVIFGHAGDGHVHVNPLIDISRPDWRSKIEGILEDVVMLTSRLGGTLSGEHGDGRLRAPLLAETWPAKEVELFALVKLCFDPEGILNPGVKLPVRGEKPIEDVKYDPQLPLLPTDARRALDFVADERAYATPRLSLLDRVG